MRKVSNSNAKGVKNTQQQKPSIKVLVRTTEMEVEGRIIRRTDSLEVKNTIWRDAKGRFLSKREIAKINRFLVD